jgi:hypothetical protein
MVKSILGELPQMIELLMMSEELDVLELRWTELQVFNLIESLTSMSFMVESFWFRDFLL